MKTPRPRLSRVGVITTSYPRFAGDAAGSFVAAHVEWLRGAGHVVDVVAADDAAVDAAADAASGVVRVPAPPNLFYAGGAPDAFEAGLARRPALAFAARLALASLRRAPRWQGIVAHWLAPSALAALPSRGPLLAIAHGGDVHLLAAQGLLPTTMRLLALRRARVVFVSSDLAARAREATPPSLRTWFDDAALIAPMGIDAERFARLPRIPPPPRDRPRLVVLARLVPIKGVDVLLDALDHVNTSLEVCIAGDGPARDQLRARAARPSSQGHIIQWLGNIAADTRDALLARASLVVIPSRELASGRTEGTPMVALEALAAGVPLVVTRTGGLMALGGPVIQVPSDAPVALAAAIERALAAPAPAAHLRAIAARRSWQMVGPMLRDHWLG